MRDGFGEGIAQTIEDNQLPCVMSCYQKMTAACVDCPEGTVRDCSSLSTCHPASYLADGIADCGQHDAKAYHTDLSCIEGHGDSECPAPVGCDDVVGSGKVVDECGVCGGNGQSCACADGACDILLTISKDDLTQTSAVVNYCSRLHFRGYQFEVKGANLTSWTSAVHEIHTECSAASGICLGFGYTDAFGYDTYHIMANAPSSGDVPASCGSPLVYLEFQPLTREISLEGVRAGGDYDFMTAASRTSEEYPLPEVKFYWHTVDMGYFILNAVTNVVVMNFHLKITFEGSCFQASPENIVINAPAFGMQCSPINNDGESTCHWSHEHPIFGEGADITALVIDFHEAIDPTAGMDGCGIGVAVDSIGFARPLAVSQYGPGDVVVPDLQLVPEASLAVQQFGDDLAKSTVGLMSYVPVRGCQFFVRGTSTSVSTDSGMHSDFASDAFNQIHSRRIGDETKIMVFSMDGSSAGPGIVENLATFIHPKQRSEPGALLLRDVRCSSDTGYLRMTPAASVLPHPLQRCDSRWPGLCDMEDDDGDGCINKDDFSPEDNTQGCGFCGDLSGEGVIDILDIVKAVNLLKDGDHHRIADSDDDGDTDLDDVFNMRSWTIDPLGGDHPALPTCNGGGKR